jgi:hypothetical protein
VAQRLDGGAGERTVVGTGSLAQPLDPEAWALQRRQDRFGELDVDARRVRVEGGHAEQHVQELGGIEGGRGAREGDGREHGSVARRLDRFDAAEDGQLDEGVAHDAARHLHGLLQGDRFGAGGSLGRVDVEPIGDPHEVHRGALPAPLRVRPARQLAERPPGLRDDRDRTAPRIARLWLGNIMKSGETRQGRRPAPWLGCALLLATPGCGATDAPSSACGEPTTAIHRIQGTAQRSPEEGRRHVVEGIVVGDFQGAAQLSGFFLQEAKPDDDPATSEGIFVYDAGRGPSVELGDRARLEGEVRE